MAITQPQDKPRGLAMVMCKAICRAIERENKKRNYRVRVPAILRAIEWTRYCITESFVDQLEARARKAGATSFTPVNARKGKGKSGDKGLEYH